MAKSISWTKIHVEQNGELLTGYHFVKLVILPTPFIPEYLDNFTPLNEQRGDDVKFKEKIGAFAPRIAKESN